MHGGLEKGKAGKSAFCDTTTAPQYKQQCEGHSSKTTLFDRVAGPWKDLKHK